MAEPATSLATAPVRHGLLFSKMHGAGNDFVVLDLRGNTVPPGADLCRALADRHRGVGCDQILTIEDAREAGSVASYRVWNADGSPSQQCGNGARCIAAWLVRDGATQGDAFDLDSPVGTHAVTRVDGGYRVAMGVPEFDPARIPLRGFDGPRDHYVLGIRGSIVGFGAVSMGNPHALIEVDDIDNASLATTGPLLQQHETFPESANIGFVRVESRQRIRLRVYERGVGETLACGSGACAAAAILMRRGRIGREVSVVLPGGELQIAWPRDNVPITMAGPATFVFEGEWLHERNH